MTRLQEADFGSFGQDAGAAVDSITKYAATALSKFKGMHDQMVSGAESEQEKARAKQDAEAEKDGAPSGQQLSLRIPRIVAQLCTGNMDLSSPEALAALKHVKLNQFRIVFTSINKARRHLAHYPAEMRKRLMSANFLDVVAKNQRTLNNVLSKQATVAEIEGATTALKTNRFKEQEAWSDVLVLGDQASMTHMLDIMKAVGAANEKANAVLPPETPKSQHHPETLGVVKLFTAERQVILNRLDMLNRAVEKMTGERADGEKPAEESPVTEEVLHRLRGYLKTL